MARDQSLLLWSPQINLCRREMRPVTGVQSFALDDDDDDATIASGDYCRGPETKRQRTHMITQGISTPKNTISPPSRTNEDLTAGCSQDLEADGPVGATPLPLYETLLPPTAQSPPPTSAPIINHDLTTTSVSQNQQSLSQMQTDEVATSHTLPVSSPHLWQFPNTTVWVALEDHIPIPSKHLSVWTAIKGQLQLDLDTVVTAMVAEQAKATNRVKRTDTSRRTIFPELRMSGHQHKFFSDLVTVSPCVWILCGSKSCRNKVRRLMRHRQLPELFMNQAVEIHERAPRFSAIQAIVPLPQLLSDIERHTGVVHGNGTILYHMESPREVFKAQSACGLLCCATFIKNGKIVDQRISRIGGLLSDSTKDPRRPIAITTSHGLLICLWAEKEDTDPSMSAREDTKHPMELCSDTGDYESLLANGSDDYSESESGTESGTESDTDSDFPPGSSGNGNDEPSSDIGGTGDSDWDYLLNYDEHVEQALPDPDGFIGTQEARNFLGRKSPRSITRWSCLEDIMGVRLCGERIPALCNRPLPTLPADYALLKSDVLSTLKNVSSWISNIEITNSIPNDTLEDGHLSLLLSPEEAHDVILLPGVTAMPFAEEKLVVRKLQLSKPLAEGTSGTWLSRGSSFAGMVVATFLGQPLALMVTAEDIMNDMGCWFPIEENTDAPKQLVIDDSNAQAASGRVSEAYTVFAPLNRDSVETEKSVHTLLKEPQSISSRSLHDESQPITVSSQPPLGGKIRSHGKFTRNKINVWYCSNCSYGPCSEHTDTHCPQCDHWRCHYCRIYTIEAPRDR
ncbi:hypothetical protein BDP55DRAFT_643760 [Colletotrichum godetiae]|uniref:Uncharacterized protein n=1 Tax=Colletotrichum godetiae TaxID=1209918 RepID=A0AAJ0B039_9PEZI|nr:uncharacterized protein BDP55DRAFT_643760 [Colletotrichum godetiae]KAK1700655.1 hypothetical protein BDP55DRAFT_643760 [Colletotrichum godetiae]